MEPQAARDGGHDGRLAVPEPAAQSGVDDLARRDGRGRGRALQDRQVRAGRLRGREPAARRAGALGLRVHRRARSGAPRRWLELRKGRAPADRHAARGGREARARVQGGRDGDGGELERHQRRGGGAARQGRQCRHGAAGAHCRNRGGGRGSRLHGPGSHSGDPEGAQACRAQHRPDRSRRAERGLRRAGDGLHARAQARPCESEYLRRRDRAGSSPRRHGRPDSDDSRTRLTPDEVPLRAMYDVHRRGPGDRHGGGAGVMAAYDRVLVDIAEGIGTLTLARPEKLNAFDREMCRDLIDALRMLSGSEQVRVILLTGAGRGFCAGADLGTLAEGAAELVGAGREVPVLIRTAPPPVLAAVNGPAAGGEPAPARRAARQGSAVSQRAELARLDARPGAGAADGAVRDPRGAAAHRGIPCPEEPLMVRKLNNFDDWIDYFRYWQDSIGLPQGELRDFQFDAKFGDPEVPHIEFGHYRGQRKWPSVMHIPDQRIRDALLNLIVYQGDTEFASVEQQRSLLGHAPTDYDLLALMRVMTEEMRHGWQMSYLLCAHFGDEGKREAAKLLERRADEGERLLGSFNEIVATWLDFFTYTQFIDRDGKFQLKMLSVSAFDPLSRSMGPMLKEESFHLGTGNNGLLRIVKAGKMPAETIQRFFYKWVPTAFDLFGNDNSSSAHWAYVWGLKGRYDERENTQEPDKAKLNEYARELYRQEVVKLVERLNMFIPERERWLKVPELTFNRKIGVYAHQMYTVDGEPIDSKERYAAYLETVLPQAGDYEVVKAVERTPDWIGATNADSLTTQ